MNECQHCEDMYEVEDSTADHKETYCSQSCEFRGENFEESDEDSGDLDFEDDLDF